jgi:hypothetical protein
MNLFTSDLFNPVMREELASRTPRNYRAPTFGRRYGRAIAEAARDAAPVLLSGRVVEVIGDERAPLAYDLAA